MLKRLLIIIIICGTFHSLKAQRFELGYDVSQLITGFLQQNPNVSNYPFSFKVANKSNTKAFRTSLGFNMDLSDIDRPNQSLQIIHDEYNMGLRLGYEWRKVLFKTIYMHYGFDILSNFDVIKEQLSNTVAPSIVTDTDLAFGLGPILGIQWHINKRFLLYTETTLYFIRGANINKTEYPNTNFTETNSTYYTSLSTRIPMELYLSYRF